MEIKMTNDGKERHQSFEANISEMVMYEYGIYHIDATGYGEDADSARESLSNILRDLSIELNKI